MLWKFFMFFASVLPLAVVVLSRLVDEVFNVLPAKLKAAAQGIKPSHFQKNVLIGIAIAIVIHLAHGTNYLKELEDGAMDTMMQLNQSTQRMFGKTDALAGYVFIDISQSTYKNWGEPWHTPRQYLKQLIEFASQGAALVIVDIALDKRGIEPSHDQRLVDYLKHYKGAPLIMVETLEPQDSDTQNPIAKPAFFKQHINNTNIHWAMPIFKVDKDHAIRHWMLAIIYCEQGVLQAMPSVQLLADILLNNQHPKNVLQPVQDYISQYNCNTNEKPHLPAINYQNRTIYFDDHGPGQRLLYSLKEGNQEFSHLSPRVIINNPNPPLNTVKNKVVIIGASHALSADIHSTPLGDMPGSMILLNAIKSLHEWGEISAPPWWVKLLIELVLIIGMAYTYARMKSIKASLLVSTGILLTLCPISFYFFKYGVWVDFALPLIGMQLHDLIAEMEER